MKTKNTTIKTAYTSPTIERITLDNEISLVLQSLTPPGYPNETIGKAPEHFNNDPFKPTLG